MEKTITKSQIEEAAHEAYEATKDVKGGLNAHYIPYLANIDPNLWKTIWSRRLIICIGRATVP